MKRAFPLAVVAGSLMLSATGCGLGTPTLSAEDIEKEIESIDSFKDADCEDGISFDPDAEEQDHEESVTTCTAEADFGQEIDIKVTAVGYDEESEEISFKVLPQ